MILTSLVAAVVPMSFYLILLWRFDKYEREPLKLVIFHFLWGATISVIIGFAWSKLISIPIQTVITNQEIVGFIQIILIAPFVEELSKGALLFRTMKDNRFDYLTDGLVYGAAIGLGFGMTENFLYFITFGNTIPNLLWLIVIRSAFSAVMHGMATAAFGALLSISKYSKNRNKKLLIVVGIIIAMSIHFIWNFSVSFSNTFLFGLFFMFIIFIIFLFVFSYSLKFEKRIISEKLIDEIPETFIPILISTFRYKEGWFVEKFRKEFITSAIKLAFRKHELEISSEKVEFYKDEIENLRIRIAELLKLNFNNTI
ncbi:MAG: PrsW family intramembrane metalloprotease [Bacteroidota bacterium]